jgi:hypothetical protein
MVVPAVVEATPIAEGVKLLRSDLDDYEHD